VTNPFDYFDHIICINLDERKDRWEGSLKEFDKVGIRNRVERFPAVKDSNGRNGCGMSHIEVVKLCKKNNYKTPLILEDDILFLESPNYVSENLTRALNELKTYENWSMFFLGGTINNKPWQVLDNTIISDSMHTTSSYVLNPSVYDYILKEAPKQFYDNWTDRAIDDWYVDEIQKKYAKENEVYTFCINPMVCLQRPDYSDIEGRPADTARWQMARWNWHVHGQGGPC